MEAIRKALLAVIAVACAVSATAAEIPVPSASPMIRGTITEIKGKRITLLRSIVVDVANAAIQKRKKAVPLESIGVGSRVTVTIAGTSKQAGGVLLGELITVEAPDGQLTGTLEGRGTDTITVAGQTIAVDAGTYIGGFQDAKPLTKLAELKQNYPVAVDLVASDAGLVAVAVMAVGPAPPTPPIVPSTYTSFAGVVRAIGETSWTVGETKVVVNAKTKIPEKLAVGDTAIVAGVK
ncbi:MAG: DUF5666 domain-containing protein, partial [Thermoanaerobaculia bacterium]